MYKIIVISVIILSIFNCPKNATEPDNNIPSVSQVQITPSSPIDNQDLSLSYNYSDADGDADKSVKEWYRNGTLTEVTGTTFPADSSDTGDKVKAKVTPYDGEDFGTEKESNEVEIERLNTAPSVSNVDLSPDDATLEDKIQLSYDYTDSENDPDHSMIEWYNNNALIQTGEMTLASSETNIGDVIKAIVKPYDGELQGVEKTSDILTIQALPTVYIAGNITELFNEGIAIANANINFGNYSAVTDAQGGYSLEVEDGSPSARLIISHPNFYERQTSSFAPTDTTLDENMVEESFNMEHYDLICRSVDQTHNPGTHTWITAPTFYVDTTAPDGSTTPITQANLDSVLSVIADLPKFAKGLFPNDQVNVEIGTNKPAWQTPGYIIVHWDNTIPGRGEHAEYLSANEIISAYAKIRTTTPKEVVRQELTQPLGARMDSNIMESIFNDPLAYLPNYVNTDLDIGNFLYSRKPGNLTPDIDP